MKYKTIIKINVTYDSYKFINCLKNSVAIYLKPLCMMHYKSSFNAWLMPCNIAYRPYHPAAQDWLPTEAKQGGAWSVSGWETSWEN